MMKKTNEKEYCLLEEPWIRVMKPDCSVQEVTLQEVFEHAHEYQSLAGEMATQDIAMLRFLLAVVHTALSPTDADGKRRVFEDADTALDFYEDLWKQGKFPYERIRNYLLEWKERFYLFHPVYPFWQVPEAKIGTEGSAAKLNGEISESSNKQKLFSKKSGNEKNILSYAEAARWILHLNAFDDTSAKPKQKGVKLPSPGTGWLGKLGLIYAEGDNLFETLLLNLVLLDNHQQCWGVNKPSWEREKPRSGERIEIAIPDNQAELLTTQSRRILLIRGECEGTVSGYTLLGGDFFDKNNAYAEQMTLWRHVEAKGADPERDTPKRHDPGRQMWREFPSLIVGDDKTRIPGIVSWVSYLQSKSVRILNHKRMIHFRAVALCYGDKDFFATEVYQDGLSFHAQMLSELGRVWRRKVLEMLQLSDEVCKAVGTFSNDLFLAAGGDEEKNNRQDAQNQFYFMLDAPFRTWLYQLDPSEAGSNIENAGTVWKAELERVATGMGREMAAHSGQQAFIGKQLKNRHYSSAEAYNRFQYQIKKLLG